MSVRGTRIIAIVLLAALVLPLAAACGSPAANPPAESGSGAPASESQPAKATEPPATAAPAKPSTSGDPQERVGNALTLLTGSDNEASVFPSYHIEITGSGPMVEYGETEVKTDSTDIKADVQGENVHMFYVNQDGETVEAYIIQDGDESKDYEVQDGVPQEALFVSLTWVAWPLGLITPLSLAGMGAQAAGSEAIDGRATDVYDVSMANANPEALEIAQSMIGQGIGEARGKVWVDQETGGLLKAVMDWEEDVYDLSNSDKEAPPVGHGSGHFEVSVSQVGNVSVSLPD